VIAPNIQYSVSYNSMVGTALLPPFFYAWCYVEFLQYLTCNFNHGFI
jgi:hypothetical protein